MSRIFIPISISRSAQLRCILHLGHAVINVSAPVASASLRRFFWIVLEQLEQPIHALVPQQIPFSRLCSISFSDMPGIL